MRILLDTNILIHREARTVVRDDIGTLFAWLDRLGVEKWIHPGSVDEVKKHADPQVVKTLGVKLGSYRVLKTTAPDNDGITRIRKLDRTQNDELDTSILAELAAGRVDALLTEDRGIHRKAAVIGLTKNVFTIDAFLEKATAENPDLADYKVLSVRKSYFGELDVRNSFFDSFRADYDFDAWFARKSDEIAYVCSDEVGNLVAFLYLKSEGESENYSSISPPFAAAKRLKVGTFKVVANGFKLGERFLKIIFDNALRYHVDEIYVTMYRHTSDQDRLYRLLEEWGFVRHGTKASSRGPEDVLVRSFLPAVDSADPRLTFPYVSRQARKFIVPIRPEYHTELLPDSILNTESPKNFVENRPNRNALAKVYISRSVRRDLRTGDLIVFYRTKSGTAPAHYTSVVTTIGVVHETTTDIASESEFLQVCRKRSVFTDAELSEHWNWNTRSRPFVVSFLYVHALPKRINLAELIDNNIIVEAPRGFEELSDAAFLRLLELTHADLRLVVGEA